VGSDEHAVILAGGKGTRLAPYTTILPKPLMPIGEVPIVEVIVRQLYQCGFRHVTMSVGYLEGLIRAYFAAAAERFPGLTLDYQREDAPLGTAGPLSLIPAPAESFLVMNGDILTTLAYDEFLHSHRESGAALTIACHEKEVGIDLGVLEIGPDHLVVGYREKPVMRYPVSMGIYAYDHRALSYIRHGERLDFPDLVLRLLAEGERVAVHPSDAIWLDIGRTEDYQEAVQVFETNARDFLGDGGR